MREPMKKYSKPNQNQCEIENASITDAKGMTKVAKVETVCKVWLFGDTAPRISRS